MKKRVIPAGIHFLKRVDDLTRLMSKESLEMDGRGGRVERPPPRNRFGPKKR